MSAVDVERMRFHATHGCHEDERHQLLADAADELVAHRALVAELRIRAAGVGQPTAARCDYLCDDLLRRHGLGGDA